MRRRDTGEAAASASRPGEGANRRTFLVTFDQVLSSASSLVVMILAAHVLEPIDFGLFSLLLLTYSFALGPTRAVISMPVLVHPEDADHEPWRVLGSGLVIDLAAGLFCVAAGLLLLLFDSPLGLATVIFGALLPLLLLHDVGRYVAIARATPWVAIALDATWLAAMAGGLVLAWSLGLLGGVVSLVVVWAGGGAVATVWIVARWGLPARGDVSLAWLRGRWDFSWRSLVGNVANNGGALVGSILMIAVSTPAAVAAVRAALLLGRPSAAVQSAIAVSAAADIARERSDDTGLRRQQLRAMLLALGVAVINLAVLLLLPDSIGELVLGKVWPLIEPLLLAVGLSVVVMALQGGMRAALLGRRQIRIAMVADVFGALLGIGTLVAGAAIDGASGAVWGLVAGQATMVVCWWVAFAGYLNGRWGTEAYVDEPDGPQPAPEPHSGPDPAADGA